MVLICGEAGWVGRYAVNADGYIGDIMKRQNEYAGGRQKKLFILKKYIFGGETHVQN